MRKSSCRVGKQFSLEFSSRRKYGTKMRKKNNAIVNERGERGEMLFARAVIRGGISCA